MKPTDQQERALIAWAAFCYRYAFWVLCFLLITGIACGTYTARNLEVLTDTADMLSEELPFRVNLAKLNKAFPQYENTLILVLDAPTPEQAHAAASRLTSYLKDGHIEAYDIYYGAGEPFLEQNGLLYKNIAELEFLADRLAAAQPLIVRIAQNPSLLTFIHTLTEAVDAFRSGNNLELDPVLDGISATLSARLAHNPRPLSWQALFNDENPQSSYKEIIILQPKLDYTELFAAKDSIDAIRAAFQTLNLENDFLTKLRITGEVALSYEELLSAMHGAEYAGLVALIIVTLILFVALRSAGAIITVLVSLLLGLVITAAFTTATIGHLNLISIAFAALYIGLAVDYAIHLILRYHELNRPDQPVIEILLRAIHDIGPSLLICALTTAIGFYAFIPTTFLGIAELGIISGTGMFISLFITLTVVPALQRFLPSKIYSQVRKNRSITQQWLALPQKWPKTVYVLVALSFALALTTWNQIRFDYNLLNLSDPNGEAVLTFRELLADTQHSPWLSMATVKSLEEANNLATQLTNLPVVDKVISIADFIPDQQDEKLQIIEGIALTLGPTFFTENHVENDDLESSDFTQINQALENLRYQLNQLMIEKPNHLSIESWKRLSFSIDQLLTFIHTVPAGQVQPFLNALQNDLIGQLPGVLNRLQLALEASTIKDESLPSSLRQRWHNESDDFLVAVYPSENLNDNDALKRFIRSVQQHAPQISGTPAIMLAAGEAVVDAFIHAFILTLLGVTLSLYVLLRKNILLVVITLLPLLLAALFTVATTALLNIPFNFANVIALPLLLGIGIDSSIHMVYRSLSSVENQRSLLQTSTGSAIFYSALTTMAGFGSLILSTHQGTASMGMLLAVGILYILICVFIILPTLLTRFKHKLNF
ncbi:MAG TPA: MMPL family transporter [Nitrosomonas sp.]|nr:MMPL family transporter [Nitrosomonas sp.]